MKKPLTGHLPTTLHLVPGQSHGLVVRVAPALGQVVHLKSSDNCIQVQLSTALSESAPISLQWDDEDCVLAAVAEHDAWLRAVGLGRAVVEVEITNAHGQCVERHQVVVHSISVREALRSTLDAPMVSEREVLDVLDQIDGHAPYSPQKIQGMRAALWVILKDVLTHQYLGEAYEMDEGKAAHFMGIFVEKPSEQMLKSACRAFSEFISRRASPQGA